MPQEYKLLLKHADKADYSNDLECYERHGGYKTLRKSLAIATAKGIDGNEITPQAQVRKAVLDSGLRGRGGAGFSCGLKWSFVRHPSTKPVYLICNADESEPGTFKDRQIIYKDPHQLLEGMIIACWANHVNLAYIYIRGEFAEGAKILNRALAEARNQGYLGKNILGSGHDLEIHIHRGAGAYICGEETGLIESLEGKRAYPRIKPPYFPAALGLYMCPTLVNNVETLCNLKHIVDMGAMAFTKIGTPNNTGTRLVSLSGDVKNPGYFEIETGKVTLGELIHDENFGGGMRDNNTLQAIIPGGSSSKVLKAGETFKIGDDELALLDVPYDFDTLQKIDTMSGSGAIIVIDDTRDIVECLANLAKFYAHESCGQCTPCREGSLWMDKALHRMTHGEGRAEDAEYLLNIAQNIQGRTICAFGEACAWPVLSFVNKFRDEFEAKATDEKSKPEKEPATA